MTPREQEDFYIGYAKAAPRNLGRFVRRLTIALVLLAGGIGGTVALLQSPFDPGIFEFGVERRFVGILRSRPYPLLEVDRPHAAMGATLPGQSSYALTELGKHGALDRVEELDGHRVEIAGSLIYRGNRTMIELAATPIRDVSGETIEIPVPDAPRDLGTHTLRGEIVDSKCYLGVMKPGRKKTHRACASLCIRGGVPPLFVVDPPASGFQHLYMTDEQGEPVNSRVLDLIAEPIEITGRIVQRGDTFVLAADPARFRRLSTADLVE